MGRSTGRWKTWHSECAPPGGPQRADEVAQAFSVGVDVMGFPQPVFWAADAEEDEGKHGSWLGGPPFLQGSLCQLCHFPASGEELCSPLYSWDQMQKCPWPPGANCNTCIITLWHWLPCLLKHHSDPMAKWKRS